MIAVSKGGIVDHVGAVDRDDLPTEEGAGAESDVKDDFPGAEEPDDEKIPVEEMKQVKKFEGFGDRLSYYALKGLVTGALCATDVVFAAANVFKAKGRLPPVTKNLLLDGAVTLASKIRNKEVTSVEVVRAYLTRLQEVNPTLKCATEIRSSAALKEAEEVDAFFSRGNLDRATLKREKPFLGVPFTVKESLEVDGCSHSVGLFYRAQNKGTRNAAVVQSLMDAGAIPIAVTNVPELCMAWETVNKVYGTTRNPHDFRRTPGGSSGGEASAIAACASPMGIGTDLGGSLRLPALFTGICAHKGTGGLVSSEGHFPPMFDRMEDYFCIGPMARYAEDLLEMFRIMTKTKKAKLDFDRPVDMTKVRFLAFTSTNDPGCENVSKSMKEALAKVIDCLKTNYGVDVKKVSIKNARYSFELWCHVVTKASMMGEHPIDMKTFLNDGKGTKTMLPEWAKFFGCKSNYCYSLLFHASLQARMQDMVSTDHGKFLDEKYEEMVAHVEELLDGDTVILYPTFPHSAIFHKQSYFRPCNLAHSGLANILKTPATHLPVGLYRKGIPVGITIMAGRNKDPLTLKVACELEKALGGFKPGKFVELPSC